ncbi:hypothetical protein [Streptomyces sp. NPDC056405]|uniref:hypothetical protein n=1 Tax=Streptomyces sp. NPDC056405 TaxID=3345811 RepID=UPI0035DEE3C2
MRTVRVKYVVRNVVEKSDGTPQPFLGLEDLESRTGRLLTEELPNKAAEDSIRHAPGDVLFSKLRPYLAKSYLPLSPGTGTGELLVMRPDPEIDSRFLMYVTLSAPWVEWANTTAYGTKMPRTSWELVGNYRLGLPPQDEQRRISDFLEVETRRIDHLLDRLRRQRQLVIEREETSIPLTVAGALLNAPPVRTGVPWMPLMHPDAEVLPLLRVLQLQRGVDLSEGQRIDGSVPVITTAGLSGWHNLAIAQGPGVVIRRYGSRGNVHWVDNDYWPHNTTLYVKNFNGNNRRYCYHLLRALPFEMEQAKAAIPGVNRNDLHRLRVAVLPTALQGRVSRSLDHDMATFQATRERIEKLGRLLAERRQALITAAVTGQFDVTTADGRNVTEGVSG